MVNSIDTVRKYINLKPDTLILHIEIIESKGNDDKRINGVDGFVLIYEAYYGFINSERAGNKYYHTDKSGSNELHSAVPVWVLPVRRSASQLCADYGYQGAARIGYVVDGIKHDGDRVGQQPYHRLECG